MVLTWVQMQTISKFNAVHTIQTFVNQCHYSHLLSIVYLCLSYSQIIFVIIIMFIFLFLDQSSSLSVCLSVSVSLSLSLSLSLSFSPPLSVSVSVSHELSVSLPLSLVFSIYLSFNLSSCLSISLPSPPPPPAPRPPFCKTAQPTEPHSTHQFLIAREVEGAHEAVQEVEDAEHQTRVHRGHHLHDV